MPPKNPPSRIHARRGFTLIELLVAVGVLTLVLAFITQVFGYISQATGSGRQRLDTDAAARIAFDIMSHDFANRVKRPDVDFYTVKNSGNDEFYFYSEAPAVSSTSSADDTPALVGYRVTGTNGLERIAAGWALATGTVSLAFYPSRLDNTLVSNIPADSIQPLCREVIRMEIEFMKKDGSFVEQPPTRLQDYSYVTSSGTLGQISAAQIPDWSDLRAIVVTVACIDREQLALLSATEITNISDALIDAASGAQSALTGTGGWGVITENAQFSISKKNVAGAVRVYRRFFPIDQP